VDPSAVALGDVTVEALAWRPDEIRRIGIYPLIDELQEDLLDILAYDFKVDWYDYEYPINTKRALIKGNILARKGQGTVYATRSVLDSLYPRSATEEWFAYGGKPGYFRLNINISNNAEEGAVVVYSTAEILRRLSTVKRMSAHLEGVSYMVRRGIVIRRRIDGWTYRVPEYNTLRCGTWWTRKTLGWSEKPALSISADPGSVLVSPELTGTLPVVKTPGWSACGSVHLGGVPEGYSAQLGEAGTGPCGTAWMPAAVGRDAYMPALRAVDRQGAIDDQCLEPPCRGLHLRCLRHDNNGSG